MIEKESKGKCLWMRLDSAGDIAREVEVGQVSKA
jgi:hypothetical protein